MTRLRPLAGSPGCVRLVADRLADSGVRLASTAGVLTRLRHGAVWDGPAGEAFGRRLGAVPTTLDVASRRLLGAVAPLRRLADALEDAQQVTDLEQRRYAEAEDAYALLEERAWSLVSAGAGEADPALLAVRRAQLDETEAMQRATARHTAAVEGYAAADRRCAAGLRSLVDDGLADPWGYRALGVASETGHAAGSLGVLGRLVPVAAGVTVVGEATGTAADTALLTVYGEGSWSELGASAALGATAFLGRGLVGGATKGARVGSEGVEVFRRMSAHERVVAGAAGEARRRVAQLRRTFDVPPPRATPSALVGGPAVHVARGGSVLNRVRDVAGTARGRARAGIDARFLDDWRLATANGTRPMYASGVTLRAAAAGGDRALDRRAGDR